MDLYSEYLLCDVIAIVLPPILIFPPVHLKRCLILTGYNTNATGLSTTFIIVSSLNFINCWIILITNDIKEWYFYEQKRNCRNQETFYK